MTWNKKYESSDNGTTFSTYQVQFGRKVRSFSTLADVEAFLKTPEYAKLLHVDDHPRLVHIITEIVGFIKDGVIHYD